MSERDPQGRDPFENLGDLIDQPVEPRDAFTAELRARLMREMTASEHSREEQAAPMDAVLAPRPPVALPIESVRRIRPMIILELAAVAVIVLGLAAALNRGWFGGDPEPPAIVPAVALQDDATPTIEGQTEPTATALSETMEPTVVPPGNFPGTVWALPGTEGEQVDFGGMLVDDDVVYRLLATPTFVGVQAVDGETGAIVWQQAHRWAGYLFTIDDDTLYFDGGGDVLTAVDASTGAQRWRANVPGGPLAIAEADDRIFVLLDTDMITALDEKTGDQLWMAQGTVPQNPTGGSTSIPAIHKIAVEGDTVAAISSYGVFSGFDVDTGTERWSHEGYDSASVTILTEDDRFIVTSGLGLRSMNVRVGDISDPDRAGECAGYFEPLSVGSVGISSASPEAETSVLRVPADTFRAQAIDPATGAIIWEQQAIAGTDAATAIAVNATNPVACVIDSETGRVAVDMSPDRVVTIGTISSEWAGSVQGFQDEDGMLVLVGMIDGVDQQVSAVVVDNGAVFLQLLDGTLIRVDSGQVADSGNHENRDDDSDHPTPESDD